MLDNTNIMFSSPPNAKASEFIRIIQSENVPMCWTSLHICSFLVLFFHSVSHNIHLLKRKRLNYWKWLYLSVLRRIFHYAD